MREAQFKVGDRVRVRTRGGTAAAKKYAGRGGCVEAIERGFDRKRLFYVRMDGNGFDTAFEERDLVKRILKGWIPGMGSRKTSRR